LGGEVKGGIGKIKIGLIISAIVIIVLAGLNIWFYMNKTSLESQLKERWDSYGSELWWHSYYQNLSVDLSTEKGNLQNQVTTLTTEKDNLQTQVNNLQAANLVKIGMNWADNHPWFGTPYVRLTGYVVNVGIKTAHNCEVEVKLYRAGVLVTTQIIYLENIDGVGWWNDRYIAENFYYSGPSITSVTVTLTWD